MSCQSLWILKRRYHWQLSHHSMSSLHNKSYLKQFVGGRTPASSVLQMQYCLSRLAVRPLQSTMGRTYYPHRLFSWWIAQKIQHCPRRCHWQISMPCAHQWQNVRSWFQLDRLLRREGEKMYDLFSHNNTIGMGNMALTLADNDLQFVIPTITTRPSLALKQTDNGWKIDC